MTDLSVLDLVTVAEGQSVGDALKATTKLAQTAEEAGYKRFWVAEHHGNDGIAGGATSVVIAHVGNATQRIRIGAGGIMLPNHSPFVIAEQFGTLAALFPGRVDLGLGRAPGARPEFAQAVRRDLAQAGHNFPRDVIELRAIFDDDPELPVKPIPGRGSELEMWMLGSSLNGAKLAAALGMPYAFASHFAPAMLDEALATYRAEFRPSPRLEKPHVMAAMTVLAADTDEEAEYLVSSQLQAFLGIRTANPGKLPPPVENYRASLPPQLQAMVASLDVARAVGSPDTVHHAIRAFVERTGADEIVCSGATYNPDDRCRSLKLAREIVAA